MYAITGITGIVGGSVANSLLAAGRPVRAVMRNVGKGDVWAERGCEVVPADIADATSLASAFKGAEGVFVLGSAELRSGSGFSGSAGDGRFPEVGAGKSRSRPSRILVDDRRTSA